MGVSASLIGRRRDEHAQSFYGVKSAGEAKVNCDAVCAASIQPEDRDGEFARLGVEITSRFQIRPPISDLDRTCGRPGFWENQELGETEPAYIVDFGLDETDKGRGTFEHLSREILRLRPRGRYGPLSCCASGVMLR